MKRGARQALTFSRSRHWKVVSAAAAIVLMMGCLAPRAEPIEGDLASVIERGMAEGKATFDHGAWDELVQKYAKQEGKKFDYVGLKREEAKLDEYLESLAQVNLSTLPSAELLALFANAYNAYTVKTILNEVAPGGGYQIRSIRDIREVFDREDHHVGGYRLSLNNMEHNILRPIFKDPRLHFAVNCASASCPPIPTRAFAGDKVDEQLEHVTGAALSSPDFVRVEDGKLLLSKIMEWYGSDFVNKAYKGAEKDLASFVRKYTRDEVRRWIDSQTSPPSVKFMSYDWSLNHP